MKELMKSICSFIGSRDILIFLAVTSAGYILLERTGLFRLEPALNREILHSTQARVFSVLIAINAACGVVAVLFEKGLKRSFGTVLFLLSLCIMAAGLWTSIYTRFEGRTVRSPGQTFNAFKSDYIAPFLYRTRRSHFPQVGMHFGEPEITHSPDMKKIHKVEAVISYAGRTTDGKILPGRLSSEWPLISDWTLIRITDIGYEVRYVLKDIYGNPLESRYRDMKLFPIGAEESFEAKFLGYVFYVRCYPDYSDNEGKPGTASLSVKNPACNLRIVRNKDIVFNGILKPEDTIRFDNYTVSLPGIRPWIEVSLVRDFGLPVAAVGLIMMLVGVVLLARKRGSN